MTPTLPRRRWYDRWWVTVAILIAIALLLIGTELTFEHDERLEWQRATERQNGEAP